jgi:hypothetical protein
MLLWPRLVCGSTMLQQSSPGPRLPKPSGHQWLAAGGPPCFSIQREVEILSPAGGVEGSKLCLFSVIMPAKCVSSLSPRFHYSRLIFYFLPLAAILESSALSLVFNNFIKTCFDMNHIYFFHFSLCWDSYVCTLITFQNIESFLSLFLQIF